VSLRELEAFRAVLRERQRQHSQRDQDVIHAGLIS
jgi:hypothetical protein